jgi:hypothetical protein
MFNKNESGPKDLYEEREQKVATPEELADRVVQEMEEAKTTVDLADIMESAKADLAGMLGAKRGELSAADIRIQRAYTEALERFER